MLEPHVVMYSPPPQSDATYVVFDRDNTLTLDDGYTHNVRDFRWNPTVLPILSLLSDKNLPVAIATNQSGVARDFFSLEQVDRFHRCLVDRATDLGVQVVVIATCPHAALEPPECQCRKPLPGLVTSVIEIMGVSADRGFMIGDRLSDLEAGCSAGLSSHLVADAHAVLTEKLGSV
jgi:D-glycero-D-manno-heptose 1,7-bisphosphate phosphatase